MQKCCFFYRAEKGAEMEEAKKEDRRVRRTRASIRRAFLELLDEKNYTQITVTELSERADINRKTFYAYYSGMEDLLFEMEKEILDQYEEVCGSISFYLPQFDGRAYFGQVNRIIQQNLSLLTRLGDLGVLPDLVVRIRDLTVKNFMENNMGLEDRTDIRIVLTADYIATGVLAMFSRWAMEKGMDLNEFVEFAGKLAVGGIREAFRDPEKRQ